MRINLIQESIHLILLEYLNQRRKSNRKSEHSLIHCAEKKQMKTRPQRNRGGETFLGNYFGYKVFVYSKLKDLIKYIKLLSYKY